ncbi:MAG: 1-(5-phosphoribosyl)-5-[(5-phosphoribosylamino)methylideneamino]imidazole-4-carboxamide isomerase [Actinobacteria bacterium]|nr:MAG: 1-(5-phosphoribosyl)-5-[(5-phosphoribosylamino)methylideneamino]imidazole-4-carboxamide isomerase [Actinomycetota bacterium]
MIVYPAVDILDGRCVRLKQGRTSDVTVYANDPAQAAERWANAGAAALHVVDLNGALEGRMQNLDAVARIVQRTDVPVQLGGGIRDMEGLEEAFSAGVARVVLGTSIVKSMDFVRRAVQAHPGAIVAGVDARGGKIALEGWVEDTELDAVEVVKRLEEVGAAAVIYTDINVDGMQTGVNVDATRAMLEATGVPIIASGGVSSLEDIRRLKELEPLGLEGVIVGRALYEEAFTLEEAMVVAISKSC